MKSSVKKLKNCKHSLEVSLSVEKVKKAFDEVYGDLGKYASVPGFRQGKAPRDLLELHYSKTAREEVLKKLIPETYEKILEEHKLDPIGYPDVTDVKLDPKEGFSYKASIETKPEINLKNYKGLKLKKKSAEVKEEDLAKNLEYMREMHSQKVPKEGSQEKENVLPKLDDEFAKDLGFEDLEKMKEAIGQNLKTKLEEESEADLEVQIINQLLDSVDFEVPETLVNSEKERLMKDAEMRIKYMETLQKKENPKDPSAPAALQDQENSSNFPGKKELEENAARQAIRQVKAFFMLDRIAHAEKIYLKKEEIDVYIEGLAAQYHKTKDEIKGYLEKGHGMDELAVNMRNKKVMEFLLKEAKIE
ncbi:MAG: trigger factor [Candidatus Omnitrophota bacterium]|nr:trigger factor [Candidatus Omnitrophota bacterium]